MDHRRQKLEKWKIEKEQKKKELASQKKKPFITGLVKNSQTFVAPPPPPKPSMARSKHKPVKPSPKNRNTQSFADLMKLPNLAPQNKPHTTDRTKPPITRQNAYEETATCSRPKLSRSYAVKDSASSSTETSFDMERTCTESAKTVWKMKEGLLRLVGEDASEADSVDQFRKQLTCEVARITDTCNSWDKISKQAAALPEFMQVTKMDVCIERLEELQNWAEKTKKTTDKRKAMQKLEQAQSALTVEEGEKTFKAVLVPVPFPDAPATPNNIRKAESSSVKKACSSPSVGAYMSCW